MTTTELNPCPFCGGEAYTHKNSMHGTVNAICRRCHASSNGAANVGTAIAIWNKRYSERESGGVLHHLQVARILSDARFDEWTFDNEADAVRQCGNHLAKVRDEIYAALSKIEGGK